VDKVDEQGPGQGPETVVVVTPQQPPHTPTPFRRLEDDQPASVVLRQTGANTFELREPFRYVGRRGNWTVRPENLSTTDLASIPQFLSWFVSSYGTHTLAALLHDHLVHNGGSLAPPVARDEADEVFRDALDDLGVPLLRSRIMWSAVTFATRWRHAWWTRLTLVLWMAAMAAGMALGGWSLATWEPRWLALALLAPIPAAVLWGRREMRAGVVGGYTLWLVMLPAALNLLAYGLYWLAESALRQLRGLRPSTRTAQLPKPPSYSAR
jgi:uncharacterized protein DUF1353